MRVVQNLFTPFSRFILVAAIVVTTSPALRWVMAPPVDSCGMRVAACGEKHPAEAKPDITIKPVCVRMKPTTAVKTRYRCWGRNHARLENPHTSGVHALAAG